VEDATGEVLGPVYGPSECHLEFIDAVWGLLMANLDLVEWALCVAGANQDAIDCVVSKILGTADEPVHFKILGDTVGCSGAKLWTSFANQTIGLCTQSHLFADAADTWCHGHGGDRTCALVAVAAPLLHELTHICGYPDPPHLPTGFECGVSYLTGSAILWGLLQRYPDAARSRCCREQRTVVPGDGDPLPGFQNCPLSGLNTTAQPYDPLEIDDGDFDDLDLPPL
jgi:hypothetical protein